MEAAHAIRPQSGAGTRFTWDRILEAAPEIIMLRSDQMALNAVVSCLRERGLRTARLPDRYVDGEILANAAERGAPLPEEPIVAHANWTANLAQKVERLKKLDMWYLD